MGFAVWNVCKQLATQSSATLCHAIKTQQDGVVQKDRGESTPYGCSARQQQHL